MCKPSAKLKLCTCAPASSNHLKHYWEWYTEKKSSYMLMGELVYTFNISKDQHIQNKELLLKRINEPDAFDVELDLAENDHLLLSFGCGSKPLEELKYGYRYEAGKWVECEYSYEGWFNRFENESRGKIKFALDHSI